MRVILLLKISTYLCLFFSAQLWADAQVVAKTGSPAAGLPSHTYSDLGEPVMGPSGHVAFAGSAYDGHTHTKAVWAGLPGQLEMIIQENDTITGFPGNVLFSDVAPSSTFLISRSGAVAFLARLKGASTGEAVLVHVNGVTRGIMKAGDPAPGFPPGTITLNVFPLAISDAGLVFGNSTTKALWFWDFEKIERISTSIGECNYLFSDSISINQTGSVVFHALHNEKNENCSLGGFLKWRNGTTELLVTDGDPVPGMPGAVFGVSLAAPQPKINDRDDVIFTATLIQGGLPAKSSVWIKSGLNDPKLLVLGGEVRQDKPEQVILAFPASFLDFNFGNHGYSMLPVLMSGGLTLLAGKPRALQPYGSLSETGISQLATIAQRNDQPPGLESSWFYLDFSKRAINNAEQYVFAGSASSALENRLISAIWRGNGGDRPRLAVKEGMKLPVDGVEHILGIMSFPTRDNRTFSTAGGQSTWFSDNGEIVFRGTLDNNLAIVLIPDDSKEQKIFTLAEQLLPQYFSPANVDNQLLEGFTYRYYPTTNTYIGIKNGEVFVLGGAFGPDVQRIDTVDNTLQFLESMAGS